MGFFYSQRSQYKNDLNLKAVKRQILLLILLSISFTLSAQKEINFTYLYDDFQGGEVKFKSGNTVPGVFNYELVTGKIHFKDNNNTVLELANPETVEFINIGENVFVHIKGSTFYQKIDLENIDLYIKHTGSILSKGKHAGYGGYSQTASIDNITELEGPNNFTKLNNNEIYDVNKRNFFYIKVNGKFKQIYSAGSLAKLFKEHESEIKDAVKEENIDFNKIEDVAEAVRFCGELLEK